MFLFVCFCLLETGSCWQQPRQADLEFQRLFSICLDYRLEPPSLAGICSVLLGKAQFTCRGEAKEDGTQAGLREVFAVLASVRKEVVFRQGLGAGRILRGPCQRGGYGPVSKPGMSRFPFSPFSWEILGTDNTWGSIKWDICKGRFCTVHTNLFKCLLRFSSSSYINIS